MPGQGNPAHAQQTALMQALARLRAQQQQQQLMLRAQQQQQLLLAQQQQQQQGGGTAVAVLAAQQAVQLQRLQQQQQQQQAAMMQHMATMGGGQGPGVVSGAGGLMSHMGAAQQATAQQATAQQLAMARAAQARGMLPGGTTQAGGGAGGATDAAQYSKRQQAALAVQVCTPSYTGAGCIFVGKCTIARLPICEISRVCDGFFVAFCVFLQVIPSRCTCNERCMSQLIKTVSFVLAAH